MRILVAPDKFKGSLSVREVAENIVKGIRDVLPEATIEIVPMADGGEGTAAVLSDALGGKWLTTGAHDPLGREIETRYAYIDDLKLAVMEMSEAAGMRRLRPEECNVTLASTFGVGQMILDATGRGARQIVIGLGGSATNDGGFGMARALGFRFFGEHELEGTVSELLTLSKIEKPGDLSLPKIVAAADVSNPLLGENGATRVFGPQKGATVDKIEILEQALTRLADVVAKEFCVDHRNEAGAGAAGGLGFGLMSFCGATIRPGFDVVAETVGLKSKMKDVDIVITGEGSLDRQTLSGKVPAGVANLARRLGKRVFAIAGRVSEDRAVRDLFDAVYKLTQPEVNEKASVARASELLRERAKELARTL